MIDFIHLLAISVAKELNSRIRTCISSFMQMLHHYISRCFSRGTETFWIRSEVSERGLCSYMNTFFITLSVSFLSAYDSHSSLPHWAECPISFLMVLNELLTAQNCVFEYTYSWRNSDESFTEWRRRLRQLCWKRGSVVWTGNSVPWGTKNRLIEERIQFCIWFRLL